MQNVGNNNNNLVYQIKYALYYIAFTQLFVSVTSTFRSFVLIWTIDHSRNARHRLCDVQTR